MNPTTYPHNPLPIQVTAFGQAHQRVRIPHHSPPHDNTVQETQQHPLATSYQRLAGNILPTNKPPRFKRTGEDFIAATDGTVKDGRGGAAVIIHSNKTKGILQSVVPVDGHPSQITSYRTELMGILTALILTTTILQQQ